MIIVTGHIHLAPGDVTEFVADVRAFAAGTRAEKGCLFFGVAVEDASAGRMLVAERWKDQESLTAHLETRETLAFIGKWTGRMRGEVLKYDASTERSLLD